MGGEDKENNLVLLTAREHFICHWLLVKRFNKGTNERNKMLYAFWRMKSSPDNNGKRYINSKAYEKLRIEHIELVSEQMSKNQKGENNSQFGKKWYTNRDTGECKTFSEPPKENWILGRNLFNGESSCLYFTKNNTNSTIKSYKDRYKKFIETNNENYLDSKQKTTLYETRKIWDLFHSSNCSSILDFCNKGLYPYSRINLIIGFKKYIPYYSKFTSQGHNRNSASNPNLIGVYI